MLLSAIIHIRWVLIVLQLLECHLSAATVPSNSSETYQAQNGIVQLFAQEGYQVVLKCSASREHAGSNLAVGDNVSSGSYKWCWKSDVRILYLCYKRKYFHLFIFNKHHWVCSLNEGLVTFSLKIFKTTFFKK